MTATRPRWAILEAPRLVLPLCLGVGTLAVVLVVAFPGPVPTETDWARFLALLVVSCVQTELSLGTEKARRYLADRPHINMTSVWMFGGAVVLPAALAVTLAVLTYLHLWLRVWWPIQGRPAYRVVFSSATIVLSVLSVPPVLRLFGAADVLRDDWHGGRALLAIAVAILVYTTVNGGPVAVAVKLHHPERPWRKTFGTKAENALELATLSLGGVTATVLLTQPVLVALMPLPVIVLHRNVLMRQLEEKAAQDSKTGLLTAEEWQTRVAAELVRNAKSREPFGVLMIDLDRFKKVNDTYGHVAGDAVLRTVAATITGQLRAYDSVGRWGGEEFVVLLPQIPDQGACDVAERVRTAVGDLSVTVAVGDTTHVITNLSASVGVACFPDAATTVDGLVHRADEAMYFAKRAGRNTVVSSAERAT
ncbi:GGDEF domain-containing protein [Actinophytocola glycyrrhizae]|uniref:GGDEF domain-containing protein n=1 Tax=Actinophytocola glycyrrhizae TaxID=2044873 RepID=A0ABV9S0U3_9PSEU